MRLVPSEGAIATLDPPQTMAAEEKGEPIAAVRVGLTRNEAGLRGDRVHIAGGVALVHAAGLDARTMDENGWALVERFAPPRGGDIRRWRQPLIIGEAKAVADLSRAVP